MKSIGNFFLSYGAMLVTTIGLIVTFYTFSTELKSRSRLEFQRTLWSKQSDIYLKTAQSIGTICAEIHKDGDIDVFNKNNYQQAKESFTGLCYGEMQFLEDTAALNKMLAFKVQIDGYNPTISDPDYKLNVIRHGIAIIEVCRESYFKSSGEELLDRVERQAEKDTGVSKAGYF